ncbi:hypothetical protein HDU80_011810 [Chytriomyces hyalinus]|nr:hypothetical protein HDU80_011810 [Chytriomyces hyalinus]
MAPRMKAARAPLAIAIAPEQDEDQVTHLLQCLLSEAEHGKRSDSGFKPEAWSAVRHKVNSKWQVLLDVQQLKTKTNTLKMKLQLALKMQDLSGWTWNFDTSQPAAPAAVMKAYIKALLKAQQPMARELTTVGFFHFEIMCDLYLKSLATGSLARGSTINLDNAEYRPLPSYNKNATEDENTGASTILKDDDLDGLALDNMPSPPYVAAPDFAATSVPLQQAYVPQQPSAQEATEPVPTRKRSAVEHSIGERPKRSHSAVLPSSAAQFLSLSSDVKSLVAALQPAPSPPQQTSAVDPFAGFSDTVQLSLAVAKKVSYLLSKYNGTYEGEECEWLLLKQTYKYCELFESPHRAATFLGTLSDDASVQFLRHMWESSKE